VKDFAPVEHQRLVIFQTEKIHIGLVGETAGAVQFADPHRHRSAVGDQPEAFLAFPQQFLRNRTVRDVHMGADEAQRLAVFVPFDLGLAGDPPDLTIAGSHDPVFGRIPCIVAIDRVQESLQRPIAIDGMDSLEPIFVAIDGISA
jgi:hypothetical protein